MWEKRIEDQRKIENDNQEEDDDEEDDDNEDSSPDETDEERRKRHESEQQWKLDLGDETSGEDASPSERKKSFRISGKGVSRQGKKSKSKVVSPKNGLDQKDPAAQKKDGKKSKFGKTGANLDGKFINNINIDVVPTLSEFIGKDFLFFTNKKKGFRDKFEYFNKFNSEELFCITQNIKFEKDKWMQVMLWFDQFLKTARNYVRFKQKIRETSESALNDNTNQTNMNLEYQNKFQDLFEDPGQDHPRLAPKKPNFAGLPSMGNQNGVQLSSIHRRSTLSGDQQRLMENQSVGSMGPGSGVKKGLSNLAQYGSQKKITLSNSNSAKLLPKKQEAKGTHIVQIRRQNPDLRGNSPGNKSAFFTAEDLSRNKKGFGDYVSDAQQTPKNQSSTMYPM